MKHRLKRVGELMKRELSEAVSRELTFRSAIVTIQDVNLTPDLKHAHVYVSALGSDADRRSAVSTLQESRVLLQNLISKRVVLKYTPQLHFHLDEAIERGDRVMKILGEIDIPNEE